MERRDFLKAVVGGVAVVGGTWLTPEWLSAADRKPVDGSSGPTPRTSGATQLAAKHHYNGEYFKKIERFNQAHPSDIHLNLTDRALVQSVVARLQRLQVIVGHGNFQVRCS